MSYSSALSRPVTIVGHDTILGFLKQGTMLFAEGRPLAAAVLLRRVTHAAPENAVGHYLLGLAYKALGRHEAATVEWRAAAALPKTDSYDDWVRVTARKLIVKHSVVDERTQPHESK